MVRFVYMGELVATAVCLGKKRNSRWTKVIKARVTIAWSSR